MKIKYLKLFLLSIFMVSLNSCSDNETYIEDDAVASELIDVKKQSVEHQALFEYARMLSLAIKEHSTMNESLQQEALKLEKYGYYEQEFYVGMQNVSFEKGFGSKSLNQILETIDGEKSGSKIKEFQNINPGMSVLLAGDVKMPTFSNRVYVDNDFDDMNDFEIVFYYENGQLYSEPLQQERYEKSFVVRNSEVYSGIGAGTLDKSDENNTILFTYEDGRAVKINKGAVRNPDISKFLEDEFLHDDVIIDDGYNDPGPGSGSGSGSGSNCNLPCERDCESGTENLWRFRTTDDYDGFLKGKGEWYFVIIWADGVNYTLQNGAVTVAGPALSYIKTGQIKKVTDNNNWFYPNYSSIIWDRVASPSNPIPDGDRMKVVCFESDGGSSKSFQAKLSFKILNLVSVEVPVNFTIENGDDLIGEYIVDYCQGIGSDGFMYHPAAAVDVQHNER